MALSIGIVGLPNVGKSTLFKALTKKQIDIQNYPFTTIDPNVGVVTVPDKRLKVLAELSHSKKIVPTYINFIDIAGLVKGAASGEGLGNKFLANIREVDAIAEVVRVFENEHITHVHKSINPLDDIGVIEAELILADLETVERRREKTKPNQPNAAIEISALDKLINNLKSGTLAKDIALDEKETPTKKELHLLTDKPFLYVFNCSEDQVKNHWQPSDELKKAIGQNPHVILSNTLELLLSESPDDEQEIILSELQMEQSGLDQLISQSYKALGLITFLTTGEDETRAWTTKTNTLIPKAATAIHNDFEKLFIRAEVIPWQDLVATGSWGKARESGKLKTVGKDYIVQDGDVVEIKI